MEKANFFHYKFVLWNVDIFCLLSLNSKRHHCQINGNKTSYPWCYQWLLRHICLDFYKQFLWQAVNIFWSLAVASYILKICLQHWFGNFKKLSYFFSYQHQAWRVICGRSSKATAWQNKTQVIEGYSWL